MTDRLLTYKEAGRRAHVSPETVKYWVKTGRLSAYPKKSKTGVRPAKVFVSQTDLDQASVGEKLRSLEEELGSRLLTVKQICREFDIAHGTARGMLQRLQPTRHYLFKNNRNFYVSYHELLDLMESHPLYYEFIAVHEKRSRQLACGCEYCYS